MDPIRPDYGGACTNGIVPALLTGTAVPWMPEPVTGARTVVLLVLDGLGWSAFSDHAEHVPFLRALEGSPITTVAPSTTSCALTSIATGLTPSEHGIVGYRMRMEDSVMNVLSWQMERGRPPDPFTVQRHDAFLRRTVPVVTKSEFRTTGFTEAHLRGSRFVGYRTTAALVESCGELADAGEKLVYAYYSGVDTIAHEYGLHDAFYAAELRFVDGMVEELLDRLPETATLLVTADHGQIHLDASNWIDLHDLAPFVEQYAGDARFRYAYAKTGAAADLLEAAHSEAGASAWVLSREQLIDEGWLGPPPSNSVRRRLGDVVLASRDAVGFVDPAMPREPRLRSAHGSLTPDEMMVPLIAARGRR